MSAFTNLIEVAVLSFQNGTLRKLTFSKPIGDHPQKMTARLARGKNGTLLATEMVLKGGKVQHLTTPFSELTAYFETYGAHYGQINLSCGAGDCEYRVSKNGKTTLLGGSSILEKLTKQQDFTCYITDLEHQKKRLLSGKEEFLIYLGISDKDGRVHDKKQAKYRQINRYLEHIEDIYPHLPKEGCLHVYDLCCGKSYLSFAVYYYLHAVKGRDVDMFCMDLKEDVIAYCQQVSLAVGFSGMRFEAGDIRKTPGDIQPDLVISLHACDIATDIVLDTACRLGAGVILSTPCCHRYLNDKINMPALQFVKKHPYLNGKLCEVMTEAIRLARLEANGYRVTAMEMTDPDDTPKNTLLRAVKDPHFSKDSKTYQDKEAAYLAILDTVLGAESGHYLKEIKE